MSVLIYAAGSDALCLLSGHVCAHSNARFAAVIAVLLLRPVITALNQEQLCRPVLASLQAVFLYEAWFVLL